MFVHPQFDPIAFSLGPLSVRWYGLMYLFAFLAGGFLAAYRARQPDAHLGPVLLDWMTMGQLLTLKRDTP